MKRKVFKLGNTKYLINGTSILDAIIVQKYSDKYYNKYSNIKYKIIWNILQTEKMDQDFTTDA